MGCSWNFISVGSRCALNYPNVLQHIHIGLISPDKLEADADFQEEKEAITHAAWCIKVVSFTFDTIFESAHPRARELKGSLHSCSL